MCLRIRPDSSESLIPTGAVSSVFTR
jgi:hypothetical protein